MTKYYATCGSQTLLLSAPTAAYAAMRLIDEAMAAHVWIYEDADLSDQDRRNHLVLEALLHLGPVVKVSQRGFGRSGSGEFEVPELINDWHRLMTGISQLIVVNGLVPRQIVPNPAPKLDPPQNPR